MHCRADHEFEDVLIDGYLLAAIGHLDGWSGVLGRCIMPQTWRVTADCAGWHVLPMPDVVTAVATYGDSSTETLAVTPTAAGPGVSLAGPASIDFTCRMSEAGIDRVRVIVLQLVGLWYANREAAVPVALQQVPAAAQALISALRWRAPL